ncbi:MAG: hypothetical protein JWM85_37 [Acidimicrobiaceae bacterium]|nr:hypothetical protein [Acidimicrobiaceae bacterium]
MSAPKLGSAVVVAGAFAAAAVFTSSSATASAGAPPASSKARLLIAATTFDTEVLAGQFSRAYAFILPAERKTCTGSAFAGLANIAYVFGRGGQLTVSGPVIAGDLGFVRERVRRSGETIYSGLGAFFADRSPGSEAWQLSSGQWWMNAGSICSSG